jgi:hypothetical protein
LATIKIKINILIQHKNVVVICEESELKGYNSFFTNQINKNGVVDCKQLLLQE